MALPALVLALLGFGLLWRQADRAVRDEVRQNAIETANFLSTTFSLTEHPAPGAAPRDAHRATTLAVRNQALQHAQSLRIVDRQGVVRWSRAIEEEDRPLETAARLMEPGLGTINFIETSWWPFGAEGVGGEIVQPLGGVGCAGCHAGESTMRVGVLQLTVDEPSLRGRVATVFLSGAGGALVLMALFGLGISFALGVYLTRPLAKLSDAMRRAEEGDFLARASEDSRDEIGQLSAAFNRMLARITSLKADEIDRERDLQTARNELELAHVLEKTNESLKGRLQELQTLYEVSGALTSTLHLKEVLQLITELVPKKLDVPKFSIMLLTSTHELEVVSAHPVGAEGMRFAIGEGICGRAAETMKSVYVSDLGTDETFKVRSGAGAKSGGCLLALPMVNRGTLLGVLNFERPHIAAFSAEEIEFFTAVADQAALAVQNARLHEQTVELSITDPLTGVPNRRYLMQQLEAEIARANRFGTQLSVLMIDIDHFKKLNDGAGHAAGDDVLRQVCDLMKKSVRRVDTLARYGGEEFVVVLPQVTRSEAVEVAEKLRRAVADAPIAHREVQPSGVVSISVGVANLPSDATEQSRLVDCADSALYASKRGGRNRVTAYAQGMEVHPGRERGPHAARRRTTGEIPVQKLPSS